MPLYQIPDLRALFGMNHLEELTPEQMDAIQSLDFLSFNLQESVDNDIEKVGLVLTQTTAQLLANILTYTADCALESLNPSMEDPDDLYPPDQVHRRDDGAP